MVGRRGRPSISARPVEQSAISETGAVERKSREARVVHCRQSLVGISWIAVRVPSTATTGMTLAGFP